MNWHAWLYGPGTTFGWLLVQSVWLGVAAAILLAITLRLMRGASSQARYVACCAAMAGVVVVMALALAVHWRTESLLGATAINGSPVFAPAPAPANSAPAAFVVPPGSSLQLRPWLGYLAAAWMTGVATLGLWQLGGWINLFRWRRAARPLPAEWVQTLEGLAQRMGIGRLVRAGACVHLSTPAVVGILRPIVLVPVSLATGLTPQQISSILAHELAHVRRHDYLVNLLQTAVETLLFYHPAIWWISGCIRQEREHCCDDAAAAVVGDRVQYARTLLTLEEHRAMVLAPAMTSGDLRQRVSRLLTQQTAPRLWRSRSFAVAILALACAGAAIGLGCAGEAKPANRLAPASPATAPASEAIGVSVSASHIEMDGKEVSWDAVRRKALDLSADRRRQVRLELSAASPELPVATFWEAQSRAAEIVQQTGLAFLSITGVKPADAKPPQGEYYIGGDIPRVGVYSMTGREITLKQAIISAGGIEQHATGATIAVIRRRPDGSETRFEGISVDELFSGKREDMYLKPNDIVMVHAVAPTTQP